MILRLYFSLCIIYILTSTLSSTKLRALFGNHKESHRQKRSAVTLRKNGKNVCSFTEAKVVYETKFTTATQLYEKEVCCKNFGGCWKKCKRSGVRTIRVSRTVSKYQNIEVNHCCRGWSVSDKGDECTKPLCNPPCQNNGICIAPDKCSCANGFTDRICQIDIDECKRLKPCQQSCINLPGTYQCVCNKGFQPQDSSSRSCQSINECQQNPCRCGSGLTSCTASCMDTIGSYTCKCKTGYRLAGKNLCIDNNECLANPDICPHECVNTVGSYQCKCFEGYDYDKSKRKCIAKPFCGNGNGGCEHECVPYTGGFVCACKSGYFLAPDRYKCIDINECNGFNPCDSKNSKCVNTQGGYYCECMRGFIYAPTTFICDDRDECKEKTSLCEQGCINTRGSYKCSCGVGFMLSSDGKTCSDINECSSSHKCSQQCTNTIGSYKCSCKNGYTLKVDGKSCHAKPCTKMLDPFFGKAQCNGKTVGSVCHFICNNGFQLTGPSSRTCNSQNLWSGRPTKCLPKTCNVPSPPAHGKVMLPCNLSYGSACPVSCNEGYILRGQGVIKCSNTNGAMRWNFDKAYCEEILVCNPNPCLNNGKCSIVTDTLYSCDCLSTGYTGRNCDKLIISISPIPKISIIDKSVKVTLHAKPRSSVTVDVYQEDIAVELKPSKLTLTTFRNRNQFNVQSKKPGFYWLTYGSNSKVPIHPIPDSLLLFYDEKKLQSVNSLLISNDCFKLTMNEQLCKKSIQLSSTGWWTKQSENSFKTDGMVFVLLNGIKFPYQISSIISSNPSANFNLVRPSIAARKPNCVENSLNNGQLQYVVKNDIFAREFIQQFSSMTPSWFHLYFKGSLNNIHIDAVQSNLLKGSHVTQDPLCNGPSLDRERLYLVYKHREKLSIRNNGNVLDMLTATGVFCFIVDTCNKDVHLIIPADNRDKMEKFISIDNAKELGWNISFKSIGFTRTNKQNCKFSTSSRQVVFGAARMTFKHNAINGKVDGDLFYDIENKNGKEVISRTKQCFVGQSSFDTPSWYVMSNVIKKYTQVNNPDRSIQTEKKTDKLFTMVQDEKSIFKLKSGLKPVLEHSKDVMTLNFIYMTKKRTTVGDDAVFDKINAIMMLQIPIMDLLDELQKLPKTVSTKNFESIVNDWNNLLSTDTLDLYGKFDDVDFVNTKVTWHYTKANAVLNGLKSVLLKTADLNIKKKLETISSDLKFALVDLSKYLVKEDKELQHVTFQFNANMCLYTQCMSNADVTLYPMGYDVGLKGFCSDRSKGPYQRWIAEIKNVEFNKEYIVTFQHGTKSYLCLTKNGVDKAIFNANLNLFGVLSQSRLIMENDIITITKRNIRIFNKYVFSVNSTLDMRLKDWSMVNARCQGEANGKSQFVQVLQKSLNQRSVLKYNTIKTRVKESEVTIKRMKTNVAGLQMKIQQEVSQINNERKKLTTANNDLQSSKNEFQQNEVDYRNYRSEMLRIESALKNKCSLKTCSFRCVQTPKCHICQQPYSINKTIPSCKTRLEDRSYGYLKTVQGVCSHIVEDRSFKYTGSCKEPSADPTYAQNVIDRLNKKIAEKKDLTLEDAYLLESVSKESGKKLREQVEKTIFFKSLQRKIENVLLTEEDFTRLESYTNKTFSDNIRKSMKKVQDSKIMQEIMRKINESELVTDQDYENLKEIDPQLEKNIRKSQAIAAITEKIQKTGTITKEDLEELSKYAPEYSRNLTKQIEKQEYQTRVIKMIQEKISNSSLQPEDIKVLEEVNPEMAEKLKAALKEQLELKVKEMENKLLTVRNSLDDGFNNSDFRTFREQLDTLGGDATKYDKETLAKLQIKILSNNATNGTVFEEVLERLDLDYDILNITQNSEDLKNVLSYFFDVLPKFDIPLILQRSPLGILNGLETIQEWFNMVVRIFKQVVTKCSKVDCAPVTKYFISQAYSNINAFNKKFCKSNWNVGSKFKSITDICNFLSSIEQKLLQQQQLSAINLASFEANFIIPFSKIVKAWKEMREEIKALNENRWKNDVKVTSYLKQYQDFIRKIDVAFKSSLGKQNLAQLSPVSEIIDVIEVKLNDVNLTLSLVRFEMLNQILMHIISNVEKLPNFIKQNKATQINVNVKEKAQLLSIYEKIAKEVQTMASELCVNKTVKDLQEFKTMGVLIQNTKLHLASLLEKSKTIEDVFLYVKRFTNFVKAFIISSDAVKSFLLPCELQIEKSNSISTNGFFHDVALTELKTFLNHVKQKKVKTIKDLANNVKNIVAGFKNGINSPVGELVDRMIDLVDNSPQFSIPMILSEPPQVSHMVLNSLQDYFVNTQDIFNGIAEILQNCPDCKPEDVFGKDNLVEIAGKLDKYFKPIANKSKEFIETIDFTPQGVPLLISSLSGLSTALQTLSVSGTGFTISGIKNVISGFNDAIDSITFIRKGVNKTHSSLVGSGDEYIKTFHDTLTKISTAMQSLHKVTNGKFDVVRDVYRKVEMYREKISEINKVQSNENVMKRRFEIVGEGADIVNELASHFEELYTDLQKNPSNVLNKNIESYIDTTYVPEVISDVNALKESIKVIYSRTNRITDLAIDIKKGYKENLEMVFDVDISSKMLTMASSSGKNKIKLANDLKTIGRTIKNKVDSGIQHIKMFIEKSVGKVSRFYNQTYLRVKEKLKKYSIIFDDIKDTVNELKDKPFARIGEIKNAADEFIDSIREYDISLILSANPDVIPRKVEELKILFVNLGGAMKDINQILKKCKHCKVDRIFGNKYLKSIASKMSNLTSKMFKQITKYSVKVGDTIGELQDVTKAVKSMKARFTVIFEDPNGFNADTFKNLSEALLSSTGDIDALKKGTENVFKILFDKDIDFQVMNGTIKNIISKLAGVMNKSYEVGKSAGKVYAKAKEIEMFFKEIKISSKQLKSGPIGERIKVTQEITGKVKSMLKELPAIFKLSQGTLEKAGIDSPWISSVVGHAESLTMTLASLVDKTNQVLNATDIAIEGVSDIKKQLPVIKTNVKNLLNSPLDQKIPMIKTIMKDFETVFDAAIDSSIKGANALNIRLTKNDLTSAVETFVGKERVKKYKKLYANINTLMTRLQNGPVGNIGKLTDSVETFIDGFEDFEFGKMLLHNPLALNDKLLEFKELTSTAGNILREVSSITGLCKTCNASSIFGNGFIRMLAEKVETKFEQIGTNISTVIDRVGTGLSGWNDIVSTANTLTSNFKKLKNSKDINSTILEISAALLKSSTDLTGFTKGSSLIFKAIFNNNKDMDFLQNSFEGLVGKVGNVLNKSAVVLPKAGDVYISLTNVRNMFNKINNDFANLQEGPVESRIQILKEITKGVGSIGTSLVNAFNQSKHTLDALGVDSSWFQGVTENMLDLSKGVTNVMNKSDAILNGAGMITSDIRSMQTLVNGIEEDYKDIKGAPLEQKFRIFGNAINKIDSILAGTNNIAETIDSTIKDVSGQSFGIGSSLGNITFKLSGMLGNISNSVKKISSIHADIASTIEAVKSGPIEKIGKLTDATKEFVNSIKNYDLSEILVLGPKFVQSRISDLREVVFESGSILKNISGLIKKHCKSCSFDRFLGKGFVANISERIHYGLGNITLRVDKVLAKVEKTVGNVVVVIDSVENMKTEFKRLKNLKFDVESFDTLSEVLSNTATNLVSIQNNSASVFNSLFSHNEDMVKLIGRYEGFMNRVNGYFVTAANFTKNVSKTIDQFRNLKDMFDRSKDSFKNLTHGPIESRLGAVKDIINVVNSVMLEFPKILKTSPLSNKWLRGFGTQLEGVTNGISSVLNTTLELTNDVGETVGNVRNVQLTASIIGNEFKRLIGSGSVGDKIRIAGNIMNKIQLITGQINSVASNASNIIEKVTGITLLKTDLFGNATANILNQISQGIGTVADRYEKFRELSETIKMSFKNIKEDPIKFALEDLPKLFNQTGAFVSLLIKDVKGIAEKIGFDLSSINIDKRLVTSAKAFMDFASNTANTLQSGARFVSDFQNLLSSENFKDGLMNLQKLGDSGKQFLASIDKLGASLFEGWAGMKADFTNALQKAASSVGINLEKMGSLLSKGMKIGGNAISIYNNLDYLLNLKEFNAETLIQAANSVLGIVNSGIKILNEFGMNIATKNLQVAQQALGYVTAIIQLYQGIKGFTEWLNDVCDITYVDVIIPKNLTYVCMKEKMFVETLNVPVVTCTTVTKTVISGFKEGKLCCPTTECVSTQDTKCLKWNEDCVNLKLAMSKSVTVTNTRMRVLYQSYLKSSQIKLANEKQVKIHEVLIRQHSMKLQRSKAAFKVGQQILQKSTSSHKLIKQQMVLYSSIISGSQSSIKVSSGKFDYTFTKTDVSTIPLDITLVYQGKASSLSMPFNFKLEKVSLENSANIIVKHFITGRHSNSGRRRRSITTGRVISNNYDWVLKCTNFNEIFETISESITSLESEVLQTSTSTTKIITGNSASQKEQILQLHLNEMVSISRGSVDEVISSWERSIALEFSEDIGSECNGVLDCFNTQLDNLTLLYEPELEGYEVVTAHIKNIEIKLASVVARTSTNKNSLVQDLTSILRSLDHIRKHTYFCDGSPVLHDRMPVSMYAYKNENFELKCSISGPAAMHYIWKKDDIILPKQTSWKLKLKDVSKGDQGYYTCEGRISNNVAVSNKVLLQVFAAPSFSSQPKSYTLDYPGGSDISWLCNGTSEPATYYQWWFKSYTSKAASLLSASSILNLRNVNSRNIGQYWCTISNGQTTIRSVKAKLDIARSTSRKESARLHFKASTNLGNSLCSLPTNGNGVVKQVTTSLLEHIDVTKTTIKSTYRKNRTNDYEATIIVDVVLKENKNLNGHDSSSFAFGIANKRRELYEQVKSFVEMTKDGEGFVISWKKCEMVISVLKHSTAWQAEDIVCAKGMGTSDDNLKCVQCVPGTFDNMRGRCTPCPVGTYQSYSGKSTCYPCGENSLTHQPGTPDKFQCEKTAYTCNTPMNILILLDASSIISSQHFNSVKIFVRNFVHKMDLDNVKVSIALFADDVELNIVTGNSVDIVGMINSLRQSKIDGKTDARLDKASSFAKRFMNNEESSSTDKNVVLFFTKSGIKDGQQDSVNENMNSLKENDVELFVASVDATDGVVKEMGNHVSQPVENHFFNIKSAEIQKWSTVAARAVC